MHAIATRITSANRGRMLESVDSFGICPGVKSHGTIPLVLNRGKRQNSLLGVLSCAGQEDARQDHL